MEKKTFKEIHKKYIKALERRMVEVIQEKQTDEDCIDFERDENGVTDIVVRQDDRLFAVRRIFREDREFLAAEGLLLDPETMTVHVYVLQRAEQLFGCTPEEIIRDTDRGLMSLDITQSLLETILSILDNK